MNRSPRWPEARRIRVVTLRRAAYGRSSVRIMIGHCPDALPPTATGDHSYFGYLEVDDVNTLHDEIAQKGAIVLQPPVDRPYGMRECTVATPDGHRFVVGQSIA